MIPNQHTTGWTDERKAECKRRWIDGESASDIAAHLGGVTRNAVIGIVNRAGLSRTTADSRGIRKLKPLPGAGRGRGGNHAYEHGAAPVQSEPPSPDTPGLTLADLPPHGACKWPLSGAGAEMVMCAKACEGVYCEAHNKVAYTPTTQAQRARLRSLAGWASRR